MLAGNPRALFLDEPSALDIPHQPHVLDLLRTATRLRGLTTIAILHDLNAAARFADRVALMNMGRVAGIGIPAGILRPVTLSLRSTCMLPLTQAQMVIPLCCRCERAGHEQ